MHDRTTNLKRILFGCAAVIVVLFGIAIWRALQFHVVSTNPTVKNISTISPFFKVTFNQKLSSSDLRVTSSPAGITGTPTVSGKVLTIPFKPPLASGKAYTITLVNVSSVNGKEITDKSFTITPTYIASSDLPEDQQQTLIKQQTDTVQNSTDPILKHLPYKTTDFLLTASPVTTKNPPKQFPLSVTVTLSQADMGNEAAAEAQYGQEVANYITSLGLNPNNYSMTYVVQTP